MAIYLKKGGKWDDVSGLPNSDSYTKAEANARFPTKTEVNEDLALKADDSKVVHKDGTETINGQKTFMTDVHLAKTEPVVYLDSGRVTDFPTDYVGYGNVIINVGKDKNASWRLDGAGGRLILRNRVIAKDSDNKTRQSNVEVILDKNFKAWATAPNADRTYIQSIDGKNVQVQYNDERIITANMLNQWESVVHQTMSEEIAGPKTFTNPITITSSYTPLIIKAKNTNWFSKPAGQSFIGLVVDDGIPEKKTSYILQQSDADNTRRLIYALRGTDDIVFQMGLMQRGRDGKKYAYAPVTNDMPVNDEIVTAGWANSKYVSLSGGNTLKGGITFENDWYNPFTIKKTNMDVVNTTGYSESLMVFKDKNDVVTGRLGSATNRTDIGKPTETLSNFYGLTVLDTTWRQLGFLRKNSDPYYPCASNSDRTHIEQVEKEKGDGTKYKENVAVQNDDSRIINANMLNRWESVAHTNGNETIAGVKLFSNSPVVQTWQGKFIVKSPSVELNTTGNKYETCEFNMQDKKGVGFAYLRGRINEDLSTESILTAYNRRKKETGGYIDVYGAIGVKIATDGHVTGYAPATHDSANGTEIVTAKWANNKYVKKSGDVMTGGLSIGDSKHSASLSLFHDTPFIDFNHARMTVDYTARIIQPSNQWLQAIVHNHVTGNEASLTLWNKDDGGQYVTCPTPSDDTANDERIATTRWVQKCKNIVHVTGNEEIAGNWTFTGVTTYKTNSYLHTGSDSVFYIKNDNDPRNPTSWRRFGRVNFSGTYVIGDVRKTLSTGELLSSADGNGSGLSIRTHRYDANGVELAESGYVSASVSSSGIAYASATTTPSTATKDNNYIVTTDYMLPITNGLDERLKALENLSNARGSEY